MINTIKKKSINTSSLFQIIEPIKIPGAVEIHATPVHRHSTTENLEVQQRVSENKSKEVETDEEDDTPNLMVEIANSLDARTEAEPKVFAVDDSTETIEYEMPWQNHHADNVTKENRNDTNLDLPLEIHLSGEGEVLILNEDIVANPVTDDATEKEQKAENDVVASATPKSRGCSRTRSCRTRSAPRSTTRRPGNTASPYPRNDQHSAKDPEVILSMRSAQML